MKNAEVEIAELAHSILSEPEEHLEKFKEFFGFGVSKISGQENVTADLSVRKLALLSATAVLIDIFPSLLIVNDGSEEEEATKLKKSSKEQLGKVKRSKLVFEYFDQLLQKLNKLKVSRGVSALLNSCVCSKHSLDDRRLQQLISVAVSLATGSKEVFLALRERIQRDLTSRAENLEIVRLIVQTVSRERSPERLNAVVPLFEGLRFTAGSISSSVKVGEKIDRQLARDLAAGSGDYVDAKRVKGEEAQILSSIIALYVRIARAAQSGQYGFAAMKTCIQGIAMNASSVNADLALELESELLAIARLYLGQKAEKQTSGLLGAIALAALLNIAKGGNDRAEILSSSVITGLEMLVPIALERLLTHSSSLSDFRSEETITLICKGAISVASQFGSDKALVSVAQALVSCLNMRLDDNSVLASELLVNIAARSQLVRSAMDPEGVLVDDSAGSGWLEKRSEVSLFYGLSSLGHHVNPGFANKLLGNLSKYCKELGNRERSEAVLSQNAERDEMIANRKKRRMMMTPHRHRK